MRIIVLGYIVRGPLGGLAWHHMQYVIGLHKLGHMIVFYEESDDFDSCYNPLTNTMSGNPEYGLQFLSSLFASFDLEYNWSFFNKNKNEWHGMGESLIKDFVQKTDLLINISGVNDLSDWLMQIPVRIFIDTDPVFVQIRNIQKPELRSRTAKHNAFFTFGENINSPDCSIPNDEFLWKPTRQPIVIDIWKKTNQNHNDTWTTVMQWQSYHKEIHAGIEYGMKSESFDPYWALPNETKENLELAIGGAQVPLETLKSNGWKTISSVKVTETPWSYKKYLSASKGEWSVAKHGYVISKSGWFSERSAAYLACGKPVITQNTGFNKNIETGLGLLDFNTKEETMECMQRVNKEYRLHSTKAIEIAKEFFDHNTVLTKLLNIF